MTDAEFNYRRGVEREHSYVGTALDYKGASKYCKLSADAGHPKAQYQVGNHCARQGAYNQAITYYRLSAVQGDHESQNMLGISYEWGRGVKVDYTKAAEYYLKSADQGNKHAQNNFGLCCMRGRGVPQDLKQAIHYFMQSVAQGNEFAFDNLGFCYEKMGDFGKAIEMFTKSNMSIDVERCQQKLIGKI